jgi:hypothetical protein
MILSKKNIINFFLFILSLSIVFFFIEIFLKNFYPQNLSGSWRIRDESGLIINKKNSESKHYWKNKEEIKKKSGGGEAELNVKYSFGEFNNRIYKNLLVDESNEKILILGDSYTFGWLLNDEDTFIYQLQKNFMNKFFVNSANGGWGTADHLKYIQLYCKKINPKEVWIFFNNADINRSILSNLYKIDYDGKLIELNPKISFQQKIKIFLNSFYLYHWFLENSHSVQLIRNSFIKIPDHNITDHNITFNKIKNSLNDSSYFVKKLFIEIKKETELCKANLKIFYLAWPIDKEDHNNETKSFINLTTKEKFYIKHDIKFYNLKYSKHMIDVNKNADYYKLKEGHPNKFGNKNIFLSIVNMLK